MDGRGHQPTPNSCFARQQRDGVPAERVAGRGQRAGVRHADHAERGVVGLEPLDAAQQVDPVGERVRGVERLDAVEGVVDLDRGRVQAGLQACLCSPP